MFLNAVTAGPARTPADTLVLGGQSGPVARQSPSEAPGAVDEERSAWFGEEGQFGRSGPLADYGTAPAGPGQVGPDGQGRGPKESGAQPVAGSGDCPAARCKMPRLAPALRQASAAALVRFVPRCGEACRRENPAAGRRSPLLIHESCGRGREVIQRGQSDEAIRKIPGANVLQAAREALA